MNTKRSPKRDARVLAITWVTLLLSTVGSFGLAEANATPPSSTIFWLLGLAALKGHLIAGVFMEMIRGPIAWAAVMSGFLLAEVALIGTILS